MHTGQTSKRWQRASGAFIIFLLVSAAASIGLLPVRTTAHSSTLASRHPNIRSIRYPASTPAAAAPTITATPAQGPVKTLVTLQGNGWPTGSQVLIFYDSDSNCTSPNLTELSPDPKPTANSSGAFSTSFSWPAVATTGLWYICAATSDHAATATAAFNVLSLAPPSLTILTPGPFMPGQTMIVQGQNWLPGGLFIAFSFQPVGANTSYPLEEYAVSLQNGTFSTATPITIPSYLPPGNYVLVATMEQQALEAQSSPITIVATPTPTPTATPKPSPTPLITVTPTPIGGQKSPSTAHRLSGTWLTLVIISGSMALAFALTGTTLLIYLLRRRARLPAAFALEPYHEAGQLKSKSGE
jgi:hypothetical protein